MSLNFKNTTLEYAELAPIVETIKKYKSEKDEIGELSNLISDTDPSIKELAETEWV